MKIFTTKRFLFALIAIILIALIFIICNAYAKTRTELSLTQDALSKAETVLASFESSTTAALAGQSKLIDTESSALAQSQSNEATLKQSLLALQNSQATEEKSSVTSVNAIAPSVVKLVCRADSSGDLDQGSGVLYKSNSVTEPYFVQTNLHVVLPQDGSGSECIIAIYPDYTNASSYIVFQTNGFTEPISNADVAFVFPEVINDSHAGALSDLSDYSQNAAQVSFCSNQNVGDHLSVLGYPAVGGSTLTVTDGIISGFETDNSEQYIKTSAKIDKGNSGGIAIEDNGCILGIPTYVQADQTGSIGRILDLGSLFQGAMPQ